MASKRLYIFILFLVGALAYSFAQTKTTKPFLPANASVAISASGSRSGQKPMSDSPFIRFHHGISESNVSVVVEYVSVFAVKPASIIPEKFAGVVRYISSTYQQAPVSHVFLYALPLRSPPIFS